MGPTYKNDSLWGWGGGCVGGRGWGYLEVMKRDERELYFYYMWAPHNNLTWKKFNPHEGHMDILTVKRDRPSTRGIF